MVARSGAEPLANPTPAFMECAPVPERLRVALSPPRFAVSTRELMAWSIVIAMSVLVGWGGGWAMVAWPFDWGVLSQLPEKLRDGTLYHLDASYNFIWSPASAVLLAGVVVPLGYWIWFAFHIVVLAWLRDRRMILMALVSLPLWIDAGLGNTVTFAVVAGVMALRGNRAGELLSVALFALVPRPIQVPLVAWLLWQRPHLRLPFVLALSAVLASAFATGYLTAWLQAAVSVATLTAGGPANFGPTREWGLGWFMVAIPAAIVLTVQRRVGVAGILLSPYLFPQYLLFLLLDLHERRLAVALPAPARRSEDRPANRQLLAA